MCKNRWLKGVVACFIFTFFLFETESHSAAAHDATVSSLAGQGIAGFQDGEREQAHFQLPSFATVDKEGIIYVSDTGNNLIRKVSATGVVTTIAGQTGIKDEYGHFIGAYEDGEAVEARFHEPQGLAISDEEILYIADADNGMIRTLDLSTNLVSTLATGLNDPSDIVIDEDNHLYVSERLAHQIVKITPDGTKQLLAGGGYEEGEWIDGGLKDGVGEHAQFNEPTGLALAKDGTLYIADTGNQRIRTLSPNGHVSTLAGSGMDTTEFTTYVQGGHADGLAHEAQFNFPSGLALAEDGTLYVADTLNHRIRQISPDGYVSTVAGSSEHGYGGGLGFQTSFDHPTGVLLLNDDHLAIVDQWNHRLRLIEWDQNKQKQFTDVEEHWGASYILELANQGFIDGYPDGTFRPDHSITRAEFTKILIPTLSHKREESRLTFSDQTAIPAWVEKELSIAVQLGIIQGYSDGTFRPSEPITRAEIVTMMARVMQVEATAEQTTGFADDEDIPNWAKGAVAAVKERGIIEGRSGNKFVPNETATRAEAAAMLLRMIEM